MAPYFVIRRHPFTAADLDQAAGLSQSKRTVSQAGGLQSEFASDSEAKGKYLSVTSLRFVVRLFVREQNTTKSDRETDVAAAAAAVAK